MSYKLLKAALKDKFKRDVTSCNIMAEVLASKLFKLTDLPESMKVALFINGFIPQIRDALNIKECKTISDCEKWARRFQKMHFVQKGSSVIVTEEVDITQVSDVRPRQQKQSVQTTQKSQQVGAKDNKIPQFM